LGFSVSGNVSRAVILAALLLSSPLIMVMLAYGDHFLLRVRVVRQGEPIASLIYLKAFYPEGFKAVGAARALDGVAEFLIPVSDLRDAWDAELKSRGRGALPAFAVTVFTNDSYADLMIVTLSWSEFKPYPLGGYKEVVIEPRHPRVHGKPINIRPSTLASGVTGSRPPPPYKDPWTYAELVWREEQNKRVTLTKIQTDSYSRGNIHVTYEEYNTLYVHVDFFFFSVAKWDVGDAYGLYRSERADKGAFAYENQVKEISIVATHTVEEWVYIDELTGEEVDRCYLGYWYDFQPTTLDVVDGEDASVNYEVVATRTGEGFGESMYSWGSASTTTESTSVDIGWFIDYLVAIGKITNPYAAVSTLIINVQLEAQYTSGFIVTMDAYGETGLTFNIEKGESVWVDAWGNEYPAVYWKIYKV